MSETNDLQYYLTLPYTYELIREDDQTWFARVRELPGCMTEGDNPVEAITMLEDAMSGWITLALEDGQPIPEPRSLDEYSGKFVVRVPRGLHRDLANTAEREGVSLNQFINTALAQAVGLQQARSQTQLPNTPNWVNLADRLERLLHNWETQPAAAVHSRIGMRPPTTVDGAYPVRTGAPVELHEEASLYPDPLAWLASQEESSVR